MPEVVLSRHEAEIGLLPSVCMACGARAVTTKSATFRAADPRLADCGGLLGLFARKVHVRSMSVLMPVCAKHQSSTGLFSGAGVQATAIEDNSISLANVAPEFIAELERTSGRMRRIDHPATASAAEEPPAHSDDEPVLLEELLELPADPVPSHRGARPSLLSLGVLLSLVAPLLLCFGLLLLPLMRVQWRQPRPPAPVLRPILPWRGAPVPQPAMPDADAPTAPPHLPLPPAEASQAADNADPHPQP